MDKDSLDATAGLSTVEKGSISRTSSGTLKIGVVAYVGCITSAEL